MFKVWRIEKRRRAIVMRESVARRISSMPILNMDVSGQLTSMKIPRVMKSQLSQWLLQKVMCQLLHLDQVSSHL